MQLESHCRVTFHKKGQPVRYRMKSKHPPQGQCMGRNLMSWCYESSGIHRDLDCNMLRGHFGGWNPSISRNLFSTWSQISRRQRPEAYQLLLVCSVVVQGEGWFKTPASSPDLNPIELIWYSLTECLRTEYKPRNLTQLKAGIKAFWSTLTPEICEKYSSDHKKVPTNVPYSMCQKKLPMNGPFNGCPVPVPLPFCSRSTPIQPPFFSRSSSIQLPFAFFSMYGGENGSRSYCRYCT